MAKPYNTVDLVNFERQYKYASLVRKIQELFQDLDLADLAGFVIKSFAEQNITDDGNGNVTLTINLLENTVAIGYTDPVYLRNNQGTLQYSNKADAGEWHNVGTVGGGSGDMLKSTYDTNDDGNVDGATALKDGGQTITLTQVAEAISRSSYFNYSANADIFVFGNPEAFYLRNNAGTVEFSTDGNTWLAVGSGGGEMLKSVYDIDNNGIVDHAQNASFLESTTSVISYDNVDASLIKTDRVTGDVYLRNNSGIIECSPDGTVWTALTT